MNTLTRTSRWPARLTGALRRRTGGAGRETPAAENSLREFGTRVARRADADRVLEQTLRAALENTGASAAYLMLRSEDGDELVTEIAISLGEERPLPASATALEQSTFRVGRTQTHDKTALCVPLFETGDNGDERVLGTLTLLHHEPRQFFNPGDENSTEKLAEIAALAVVNSRLFEGQRREFMRSLQALARTVDARNEYTRGHSERVAAVCVLVAEKLGVAPEIIDELKDGALLHDVGKVGVSEAVLDKPGQLTPEEFALVKEVPLLGVEICAPLDLPESVQMLIRSAHEKLDGTGYPDGLKYGELPLPLRILCVADAFDALSTRRPYRPVINSQFRKEQLNRFAGTQFDPTIVETLKSLLNTGALDELYADHWSGEGEIEKTEDDAPGLTMLRAA